MPEIIHCRECRFFEWDSWAEYNGLAKIFDWKSVDEKSANIFPVLVTPAHSVFKFKGEDGFHIEAIKSNGKLWFVSRGILESVGYSKEKAGERCLLHAVQTSEAKLLRADFGRMRWCLTANGVRQLLTNSQKPKSAAYLSWFEKIALKLEADCKDTARDRTKDTQVKTDGETTNIWNDDVAIDHMIALREDNTISKKELAKELGLETKRLEYFLKLPLQTKVGLFNRIAEKFGWELYLERQMPIKLPLIVGDSVAEENIKNLEKTRLDQNITLEELSTKTRLSVKNYLKPVEKGEIPCSILAYNRIGKVFNWEQYPSRKFMRERKLMEREQKLRRTFGKNYKPAK